MFKKLVQTSITFCLLLTGGLINARQTSQPSQPLFTIVGGSSPAPDSNTSPAVALPVLGFVLDQSGALRPVIGVTGAASVGAPLNLGFPIVQAAMPPSHDYILARTGNAPWPVLLQVRGKTITVRPLAPFASLDASRGIDSIAVSPTGAVAGLFSASQGRIYAYGNLDQSPMLLGTFDTSAIGNIAAFGINDDGSTVLAGGSSPNAGSLYLINSGQAPQLIGSIQHSSAIQFLRNSSNAIVADDTDNKVFQVTSGQLAVIASANDGIATPAGIGVSRDNQKVFIANTGSSAVTTLSLNGSAPQSLPCNCTVTGIQATSADSVFEVTAFYGGPISLFDGGSATPRMVFVPLGAQF
jgi:hypothetical protein